MFKGKEDAINGAIEILNKQIESHQRRLIKVEQGMRERFTALEIALGRMQTQSDFIIQQMALLS